MQRGPKHKESFPPPMDLPITPLPASNPLQEHLVRKGIVYPNMPMQPGPNPGLQGQGYHPKRPSFHPSGAETDTDLPVRKRTRSPPKTPTQGSPAPAQIIRRGNSFNSPPQQNKGFIPAGSEYGLLGLTSAAARARSTGIEGKKEEDFHDDVDGHGRQGSGGGLLDGSLGSSSNLSFVSTITEAQWKQMEERDPLGAEGDDEESESGDTGIMMWGGQHPKEQQREQRQEVGVADEGAQKTIGLGPGFSGYSGGLGRAKAGVFISVGQGIPGPRGYQGGARSIMGMNTQHNPQLSSQLDDDFTDFTETEGGDYTREFNSNDFHGGGEEHYEPEHHGDETFNESLQPGQLGPNHPPSGTVYSPRPPTPEVPSMFYPPSPTLSTNAPITLDDIIALEYTHENGPKRFGFFRSATYEEWTKYGQMILQKQAELAKEMIKSREARMESVKDFEEELRLWEGEVDTNMEKAKQYMARMKTSFDLLKVG